MPRELSDLEKRVLRELKKRGEGSLAEAVLEISRRLGSRPREVASALYSLWKKGYLDLVPESPPSSVLEYALSAESIWFWTATALVAITALLVFYVTTPPLLYLRYVLGSLYVLYLPGAMLVEALYPRGEELEGLERVALSIGLSLALVPLVGLVLNYTPWGIRLERVWAWHKAMARASEASICGFCVSLSRCMTIICTCCLSAPPVPAMACLTCVAVYSAICRPASAPATMAAPRA